MTITAAELIEYHPTITPEQATTLLGRLTRGIDWLDALDANWADSVDADMLDLGSAEDCVLGQLYGNFFDIVDPAENYGDPDVHTPVLTADEATGMLFTLVTDGRGAFEWTNERQREWAACNWLWVQTIEYRQ